MEEKNNIKVSVCISVHNTAKYLPRCLDSVCAQTLDSLEIVVVNNGSTDNSEDIMHQYAEQYQDRKFVIISQEDRSLAGGRQTGINNATGEFITFLDADDFVIPTAYEKMLSCAEQNHVDIVEGRTVREGQIVYSPFIGLQNTHEILKSYFDGANLQSMLWLRLYRRELFITPLLPTLYTNNEDMFAMPCLFYAAKSIFFLDEVIHTYSTDNEGGVMASESNNPKLVDRRFNSQLTALLAIDFFKNYVGELNYMYYYESHNRYAARTIFGFLITNFGDKPMSEKEIAVAKTLGFPTLKDLHKYLRKWLPKISFNSYGIYRLLGLRAAYYLGQSNKK